MKRIKTDIDTTNGQGRLMVAIYNEILDSELAMGEMAFFPRTQCGYEP